MRTYGNKANTRPARGHYPFYDQAIAASPVTSPPFRTSSACALVQASKVSASNQTLEAQAFVSWKQKLHAFAHHLWRPLIQAIVLGNSRNRSSIFAKITISRRYPWNLCSDKLLPPCRRPQDSGRLGTRDAVSCYK